MRTMRTLGTLFVICGTVVLAYGCSAAGTAPIGDAPDGSTPTTDYGGGGSSDASSGSTTPKKDSGAGGGAYDAAPPPKAAEGSPCDSSIGPSDPEASESCGICGTQTRICTSPDGGSTGTVWAAWGACNNEKSGPNTCDPSKTYTATACGNCGTIPQICDPTLCTFEPGFDCTEPTNACHPTDTQFVLGASCPISGQGRVYTCGATCTLGTPGACEAPPPNPNTLTLSATVGGTVNGVFSLPASPQIPSVFSAAFDDTCPANVDTGAPTSGVYVAINNTTARSISVSLWDGPSASGGTAYDTVMAWYNTPVFPPPDLTACGFINDQCDTTGAECFGGDWSALVGSEGPTIPAGGTVQVYVGMYSDTVHGSVKLYAKSEN